MSLPNHYPDRQWFARICDEITILSLSAATGLIELHPRAQPLFAAVVNDADRVAGAVVVHYMGNILGIFDLLAIDFDDEIAADYDLVVAIVDALIAALNSRAGSGRAGSDLHD